MKKQKEISIPSEKTNITVLAEAKTPLFKKAYVSFKRMSILQKLAVAAPASISAVNEPSLLATPTLWLLSGAILTVNLLGHLQFGPHNGLGFKVHRDPLEFSVFKENLKTKMLEMNSNSKLSNEDYSKIYKVYRGEAESYTVNDLILRGSNDSDSMLSITVDRPKKLLAAFEAAIEPINDSEPNSLDSKTLDKAQEKVLEILDSLGDFAMSEDEIVSLNKDYRNHEEERIKLDALRYDSSSDYFLEFDEDFLLHDNDLIYMREITEVKKKLSEIEDAIYLESKLRDFNEQSLYKKLSD